MIFLCTTEETSLCIDCPCFYISKVKITFSFYTPNIMSLQFFMATIVAVVEEVSIFKST